MLDFKPAVIAEGTAKLHTLSVSEAVMELDMTGVPVVVFRHGVTGRVNVVYRRYDGNIGWGDAVQYRPGETPARPSPPGSDAVVGGSSTSTSSPATSSTTGRP